MLLKKQANFLLTPPIKELRPSDVVSLNTDDAYEAFKELRWGWCDGQATCSCGSTKIYEYGSRNIFKCPRCGKQFSASSGTIFHARKLPHKVIIHALSIRVHDPMNAYQLCQELEIQYKTSVQLTRTFNLFAGNIKPTTKELNWPFIVNETAPSNDSEALVLEVSKAVPHGIPEQIRADVCQDLILGVLEGHFTIDDIKKQIRSHITKHYKACEFNKFRDLSFDQPVPRTEGLRWDEILESPIRDWGFSEMPEEKKESP